jgi:hypothetical protein
MKMMLKFIPLIVILITEAALSASHMTWASEWWRQPFMGSDRWHILSALSHWPIVLYVMWQWKPLYKIYSRHTDNLDARWIPLNLKYWLLAGILSQVVWTANKALTGKLHWGSWWLSWI